MLTIDLVLGIINKILDIWLEYVKKLSPEQIQREWERHEKRLAFWENIFNKLQSEVKIEISRSK